MHRRTCKLNQETHDALSSRPQEFERFEALRNFTRKHRANIAVSTIYAARFDYRPPLSTDPVATSKDREDVLVIKLRTRPNALRARPEKRFYVVDAQYETLASAFSQQCIAEMRLNLHTCREEATIHRGPSDAVLVVMRLSDPDMHAMDVFPVAFSLDQGNVEEPIVYWKDYLIWRLNEGIVE